MAESFLLWRRALSDVLISPLFRLGDLTDRGRGLESNTMLRLWWRTFPADFLNTPKAAFLLGSVAQRHFRSTVSDQSGVAKTGEHVSALLCLLRKSTMLNDSNTKVVRLGQTGLYSMALRFQDLFPCRLAVWQCSSPIAPFPNSSQEMTASPRQVSHAPNRRTRPHFLA